MKKIFGVFYILLLHLLLIFILLNPGFAKCIHMKFDIFEPHEIQNSEYYRKMSYYYSIIDKNVPKKAILFIGDSHIQMLTVSAVADKSVNYGISGDTTSGVLKRLPFYGSLEKACGVVLAAGHNDIKENVDEEVILRNYMMILERMPDNLPVFFSSVLPVDERAEKKLVGMNYMIKSLNKSAKIVCNKFPNCIFMDFEGVFADESGNLSATYHNGKGVHLNAKGYSVLIGLLKDALSQYADGFNDN